MTRRDLLKALGLTPVVASVVAAAPIPTKQPIAQRRADPRGYQVKYLTRYEMAELMAEARSTLGWVSVVVYANQFPLLEGEVGIWRGVRYVQLPY